MKKDINFVGLKLKNPIFIASGIAGFGEEYFKLFDLNILGGFIIKTITLKSRKGNPPPRIMETPSGMINTIGLENPGLDKFIQEKMPSIRKLFQIPVVVSIGGENLGEFIEIVKRLNKVKGISVIELNLSCPNIKNDAGYKRKNAGPKKLISQDKELTYRIVKAVKRNTDYPIIAKLTPAVTDIIEIAVACQNAGADALSLINSFPAFFFPKSSTQYPIIGGLSGPCIKPIALRIVYEVSKKVKIPIMGVGGISSVQDVMEYFSVGAKTVAIGSTLFRDPNLPEKIINNL